MKTSKMLAALSVAGVAAWRAMQWARRIDLRGKVVVITGGSRGLGLALARELGAKGARVAICARTAEDLVWAKQDIEQRGGPGVLALPCDVSDPTSVARFVAEVRLKLAPIDVVINNAGIIAVGPIEAMTRLDFERVMAVNFWGAVNMTMAVLASMRERKSGHIVNISSIGAKVAVPHLLAYDCAKFAVQGFSEGLRAEVAKDDVCVTTIVPGLMRTGSALNATFKGDAHKEVVWFAVGDAMRLTAMDASRAARRIVRAIELRENQVTLTWQAKLLRLAHALAPSLVVDVLGLLNRMLPPADGHGHAGSVGRAVMKPELRQVLAKDAKAYNQAN